MIKLLTIIFFLIVVCFNGFSQKEKLTKIYWSETKRLKFSDFDIRKPDSAHVSSFGSKFTIEYDNPFFTTLHNMGKHLHNVMIKEYSWIDTSSDANAKEQLRITQTMFDINEIYTRKLRQKTDGKIYFKNALRKYYPVYFTESSNRQDEYERDVLFRKNLSDSSIQIRWERVIHEELNDLSSYAIQETNK